MENKKTGADIKARAIVKQKMPWCRFYSSALESKSIRLAAAKTKIQRPLALGYFVSLLALASDSDLRGFIMVDGEPIDTDYMAALIYADARELKAFVDALLEYHALDIDLDTGAYYFTNWDRYQFESDSSTKRTAAWRAKHAERKGADKDADSENINKPEEETDTYTYHTIGGVTRTSQERHTLTPDAADGASAPVVAVDSFEDSDASAMQENAAQKAMAFYEAKTGVQLDVAAVATFNKYIDVFGAKEQHCLGEAIKDFIAKKRDMHFVKPVIEVSRDYLEYCTEARTQSGAVVWIIDKDAAGIEIVPGTPQGANRQVIPKRG